MSDDLDDLVRRVDPDRWLSSRFIADPAKRADVIALYAYDHELARAPKVASNPLLGEIRLTWWREMLDEAFEGRPVRQHPTAQALADVIARHDLPREPLEAMIDARYRELDATPMNGDEAREWALGSGGSTSFLALTILEPQRDVWFAHSWGAIWSMGLKLLAGGVQKDSQPDIRAEVRVSLAEARTIERHQVGAEGFPAVAYVTFASSYARSRDISPVAKRLRLTWAVARGRL